MISCQANSQSLGLLLAQCHFCCILLVKAGHKAPDQIQCGRVPPGGHEYWKTGFFGDHPSRLATTSMFMKEIP